MVSSDTFAEFLRELLAPLGGVTMRRMFGKTGVFCDGVMLGMRCSAAGSSIRFGDPIQMPWVQVISINRAPAGRRARSPK